MATTRGSAGRGPGRPKPTRSASSRASASRPNAAGTRSRPGSSAAGTRPATGAPVRPTEPPRREPPQVWRLVTLVVLVGFIAMFLFPTLRGYMDQRADISRAQQVVADEERRIAELKDEIEAWNDPAFIELQARERLRYVREGEVAFTVLDDLDTEVTETMPGMAPVTLDAHQNRPWYGEVWESVRISNEGIPEESSGR